MGKRILCPAAAVCLLALMLFAGCAGTGAKGVPGAGPKEYFGINDDAQAAIVLNNEVAEDKGLVSEKGIYLPWSFVWENVESGFYYEEASGSLYLTFPDGSNIWTEDDGSGYILNIDGIPYILTDCIAGYSDADVRIFENPARVVIQLPGNAVQNAQVKEDTALYLRPGDKGGVLTDLSEGDEVVFQADEDGWSRVSTFDGYTGYLESTLITEPYVAESGNGPEAAKHIFEKQDFGDTVRMIWDFIEFQDDHQYLEAMLEKAEGINVISPTWYTISGGDGSISSLSEGTYVTRAHDMGMQVWPLIADYTGEGASTGQILSTEAARRNIIDSLMKEADALKFDGINVDLELVRAEYAPDFIQFIRELCVEAHERDLIVSVNNYVPTFTEYYNRGAQIKACDYIVVMAYDEHTASSDEIGSAASYPFVKQGVEDTLKEVPADRTILGVPFYSRAWTEVFGQEGFSTQALDMESAEEFIKEHDIDTFLYWSEQDGQYYGTSTGNDARYSIWQEEERSLSLKLDLVNEYSLAGAAAWRLGYEKDTIWETWTNCLGK